MGLFVAFDTLSCDWAQCLVWDLLRAEPDGEACVSRSASARSRACGRGGGLVRSSCSRLSQTRHFAPAPRSRSQSSRSSAPFLHAVVLVALLPPPLRVPTRRPPSPLVTFSGPDDRTKHSSRPSRSRPLHLVESDHACPPCLACRSSPSSTSRERSASHTLCHLLSTRTELTVSTTMQSLIQRSYRDDVPASAIERFLPLVLEQEEEGSYVVPCFSSQGINYLHIRHNNLYREPCPPPPPSSPKLARAR